MSISEAVSLKGLRRRLFDVLDSRPVLEAPVIKAIPVAFPVVEASYILRERVSEPIGLVRRAVLKAVCEFGPCDSRYLDELTGLGPDVIERTLFDIGKSVPDLALNGNDYSAGPECGKLVKGDGFERFVTHERKFVVNGLTDQLLPADFWRTHKGLRLFPDPSNPTGPMCIESGQPTPIAARIVDRAVTGHDHLEELANNGDAKMRQEMGVPTGVCERLDEPTAIRIAWVLGFVMMRADDSVEVLSARRYPHVLLDCEMASHEYIRCVCQGLKSSFFNVDRSTQPSQKWHNRWPQGTQIEQRPTHGELVVRLADPIKMTRSNLETGTNDKSTRMLLEHGRDWNSFTYAIYRIVPGDLPTAKTVALLRGIRELRFILRPLESSPHIRPPFELSAWWQKWQAGFSKHVGIDFSESPVTVDQLLDAADQVNDTEFHDKLEWLLT